jgi:hypothetical protein
MNLRETVERYLALGEGYGKAVALADFGMSREETEKLFAAFDEDYHISRYFHLSNQQATVPAAAVYQINGFPHTHVSIDAEIAEVL